MTATGKDLDALVAERLFHQTREGDCPLGDRHCGGKYSPQVGDTACLAPFSTSINAAMLIVRQLHHLEFFLRRKSSKDIERPWEAVFILRGSGYESRDIGVTAAEAICRAALLAVGS